MPDSDAIDITDNLLAKAGDEGAPIMKELGSTGLVRFAGTVYEEPVQALAGANGINIYKQMSLNDATVGAILYAITTLVRQIEWEVDPPEDNDSGQEAADFVKECMQDMSHSWEDFVAEILTMGVFGWSGFEIVYKQRIGPSETDSTKRSRFSDKKIGWRKFAIRAQDTLARWEFGEDGGVIGMWQQAPPEYKLVVIPVEKLLLFRTNGHKNNPEGRSWLRNAWRSWHFKKFVEEIEGIGIERDLAGLPVAYVPKRVLMSNASPEDKDFYDRVKSTIAHVRRNEQDGIMWPLEYDDQGREVSRLELLTSGGRREFDTSAVIERWDRRIAMTVLADFIMLGHQGVGSYALSSDKTDIFAMTIKSIADSIAAVVNRHAIPRLFAVNGMPLDALPQIRPGDIEKPDLAVLGEFLNTLNGLGVPLASDPETVQWLRTMIEAPQLADETLQSLQSQAEAKAQPGPPQAAAGAQEEFQAPQAAQQPKNGSQRATAPPTGR